MEALKQTYIGILDGSGDSWRVVVPDIAEAQGGGPTPEAAIADAASAASEIIRQRLREGHAIPIPTLQTSILPELRRGERLVEVVVDTG